MPRTISPSHLPQELRRLCQGRSFNELVSNTFDPLEEDNEGSNLLLERLWSLGSCEDCVPGSHLDVHPGWMQEESVSQRHDGPLWEDDDDEHSWHLREKKKFGETIYKGHRSLMLNLQLGIRYSVGKVTPEKKRKLLLADFGPKARLKVNFSREGSQHTPHNSADFKWKDRCPMVFRQISRDCELLESENIMDYSLLLGLHFKKAPSSTTFLESHGSMFDSPSHEYASAKAVPHGGYVDVLSDFSSPPLERYDVQISSNMPARACRRLGNGKNDLDFDEAYDVVLYFGIIDILQEYDMGKKLEHAYKSLHFDSLSISAVDPELYSKRFPHFINSTFPAVT